MPSGVLWQPLTACRPDRLSRVNTSIPHPPRRQRQGQEHTQAYPPFFELQNPEGASTLQVFWCKEVLGAAALGKGGAASGQLPPNLRMKARRLAHEALHFASCLHSFTLDRLFAGHLPWLLKVGPDQDQTRQDKTRQEMTRHDKTRQDKTRRDERLHLVQPAWPIRHLAPKLDRHCMNTSAVGNQSSRF